MGKKYVCKDCKKEYTNKYQYAGHRNIHSPKFKLKNKEIGLHSGLSRLGKPRKQTGKPKKEKTLIHACKYCKKEFKNGNQLGGHVVRCKFNPNKAKPPKGMLGKKLSAVTRKKLSISRKRYLRSDAAKHNWCGRNFKESDPERIFREKLTELGIKYLQEYIPKESKRLFRIDFAIIEKKIGFEINGNQHYTPKGRLKKYYKNRKKYLESLGWKMIDIPYLLCYNSKQITSIILSNL